MFENFDKTGKNKGFIVKTKKNPEHLLGLAGGQYFYLLTTFVHEKRMFYLRNPYPNSDFRGEYANPDRNIQALL